MFKYNKLDLNQTKDEIHIRALSKVLSEYRWLTDVYNVDYFVDNHWSKLPKTWSNSLQKFDIKDIQKLLSNELSCSPNQTVLPLSLLSLRATCGALQLCRKYSSNPEIVLSETQISLKDKLLESELKDTKHWKMKYEILNRNIKEKKRHEITRLSHLTDELLKSLQIDCKIIDCGSGQGHLSRILSLCFGYDVISIEGNCDNIFGAKSKDSNTLKSLIRYKLTDRIRSEFPKKVNYMLSNSSSISEVTENNANHVLLGLHTCGPLSPIILNQLRASEAAKALLLIPCCYMKIEEKSFPLSRLSRKLSIPAISYPAKEVACHAVEKFIHKIKTNDNLDSLKVHCFRAILESLINKFNPNMRHKALKRVRIDDTMTFGDYYQKAVFGLDVVIPEEELNSQYIKECLKHEKRVVIFYSLRLLIAPLVETLILLDFINYLKEEGIRTAMFPLFDPIVSPRNSVLIAIKD